jgi:WhiB family redox-sensing transcriptional regulator
MSESIIDLFRERWMLDAACKGKPSEWWFPVHGANKQQRANVRAAKALCTDCLVREECLDFAQRNACDGIWGGVSLYKGTSHGR